MNINTDELWKNKITGSIMKVTKVTDKTVLGRNMKETDKGLVEDKTGSHFCHLCDFFNYHDKIS